MHLDELVQLPGMQLGEQLLGYSRSSRLTLRSLDFANATFSRTPQDDSSGSLHDAKLVALATCKTHTEPMCRMFGRIITPGVIHRTNRMHDESYGWQSSKNRKHHPLIAGELAEYHSIGSASSVRSLSLFSFLRRSHVEHLLGPFSISLESSEFCSSQIIPVLPVFRCVCLFEFRAVTLGFLVSS